LSSYRAEISRHCVEVPGYRAAVTRDLSPLSGDLASVSHRRPQVSRDCATLSTESEAVPGYLLAVTTDLAVVPRDLAKVARFRAEVPTESTSVVALLAMGTLARASTHADLRALGAGCVHISLFLLQLTALLAMVAAILGTDRLGRPLTDEEKKRFGALLLEHDYPGQRLVALKFAFKLTRNKERAQDLMGRADLRLVRFGWDPNEVTLKKRLCRLVWSEWTNEASETEATRKAEEAFLQELEGKNGWKVVPPRKRTPSEEAKAQDEAYVAVPSHEQAALSLGAEQAARTKSAVKLEKLRILFEKAGDTVNLLWLEYMLADIVDLQKMAEDSGRPVEDFYAAAKRRKRAVQRLLANDRGVVWKEEEEV
jgi:hypothetical protein